MIHPLHRVGRVLTRSCRTSTLLLAGFFMVDLDRSIVTAFSSPETILAFQADSSPPIQRLTHWLDEELKDCDGVGATAIGQVDQLRGLYATENYEPGEYIVAIPTSACLTVYERVYDILDDEKEDREAQDIRDGALALRKLLFLNNNNTTSNTFWNPYLDSLPTEESSHFDATPDFWDDDLIQELEIPQLVSDMLQRREQTRSVDVDTPSLAFATWLVRSRAFTTFQMLGKTTQEEKEKTPISTDETARTLRTRTMLIPYIDMLNHAPSDQSNTSMEKIETPEVLDPNNNNDDDVSYFALVATKPISAGDELTLTYGTGLETCLDHVTKYGFWLPNNPNDAYLNVSHVRWSSTIEQDEQELTMLADRARSDDRRQRDRRSMLELRIHLKKLQQLAQ